MNLRCHPIVVNLDDEASIKNGLVETGAGSIYLVTTTDFLYPTDTTYDLKSRSFKEAEDLEYEAIRRVCVQLTSINIDFVFDRSSSYTVTIIVF